MNVHTFMLTYKRTCTTYIGGGELMGVVVADFDFKSFGAQSIPLPPGWYALRKYQNKF